MPMCSMEQKRCISVASREGDEGERKGGKNKSERENMEMTSWVEALKIFTPPLLHPLPPPVPSSIFHRCLMSSGDVHLRRSPQTSCQPEVGAAADDLTRPDEGCGRLCVCCTFGRVHTESCGSEERQTSVRSSRERPEMRWRQRFYWAGWENKILT